MDMDCQRSHPIYFAFLCNLISLDGYSVNSICKHFSDVETSFRLRFANASVFFFILGNEENEEGYKL
jgi:hypothetical protein